MKNVGNTFIVSQKISLSFNIFNSVNSRSLDLIYRLKRRFIVLEIKLEVRLVYFCVNSIDIGEVFLITLLFGKQLRTKVETMPRSCILKYRVIWMNYWLWRKMNLTTAAVNSCCINTGIHNCLRYWNVSSELPFGLLKYSLFNVRCFKLFNLIEIFTIVTCNMVLLFEAKCTEWFPSSFYSDSICSKIYNFLNYLSNCFWDSQIIYVIIGNYTSYVCTYYVFYPGT